MKSSVKKAVVTPSEETVKDEAENTRNEFIDFLNSHNIDEIVSENLKDDDEATVIEIE